MKYLLKNIAYAILLSTIFNCATEPVDENQIIPTTTVQNVNQDTPDINTCNGDNPKARITNNGTLDTNLEIYNEHGGLVGHAYNIAPGNTSDWETFSEGETTFVVSNTNADKIIVIEMGECMVYDIVVGANNQLESCEAEELD